MAEEARRQPDWFRIPLPEGSPAMVNICKDGWNWIMSVEANGFWELDRDPSTMEMSVYLSDPYTAFEYKLKFG